MQQKTNRLNCYQRFLQQVTPMRTKNRSQESTGQKNQTRYVVGQMHVNCRDGTVSSYTIAVWKPKRSLNNGEILQISYAVVANLGLNVLFKQLFIVIGLMNNVYNVVWPLLRRY